MSKSIDNKTISVTVYFFTDDLAEQDGAVIPATPGRRARWPSARTPPTASSPVTR